MLCSCHCPAEKCERCHHYRLWRPCFYYQNYKKLHFVFKQLDSTTAVHKRQRLKVRLCGRRADSSPTQVGLTCTCHRIKICAGPGGSGLLHSSHNPTVLLHQDQMFGPLSSCSSVGKMILLQRKQDGQRCLKSPVREELFHFLGDWQC